jgi:hypothetical protein
MSLIPATILVNPNRAIPSPILGPPAPAIPSPILVPPATQIPSPILVVPPERQVGNITSPASHYALMRRADAFFKKAPTAAVKAPSKVESFPSTDLTPKNEFGVSRRGYNVNGELWVKVAPAIPNAKATWFDLGRFA